MEVGGEDAVGADHTFNAHGGGDVGEAGKFVEVGDGHDELAEHAVGAVDEGEAFFFGKFDGVEPCGGEGVGGVHEGAVGVADLAFTDDGEGAVG